MELDFRDKIELAFSAALATRAAIERFCQEARQMQARAVIIPSGAILVGQHFLGDDPVKICCTIGGESGSTDTDAKRYETELAIDAGAHEIELVPSLARFQDRDYPFVLREIRDIVEAADERPVRIAVEPMLWSAQELNEIVQIVLDSGAQFLCTSRDNEESAEDEVRKLRAICGPDFGIVARIADENAASGVIAAGANLVSLGA